MLLPDDKRWEIEDSLEELALLADTAGAYVVDRVTQGLPRLNVATFVGKGKVQQIKTLVDREKIDLVIFDDDLSTVQLRNLERELKTKLLDRAGLILDIFANRAKTAQAKTQVELAQLEYMMTRLTRQWTHLSRQKGGIGTKGPGETQIETDRRLIRKRIGVLRDRLSSIDRQRSTQRKGRSDQVRVSLVGYTNAGKSTLMNAMADASVFAEDRLFATLDATTRQVYLDTNKPVLLTDTVGFIRKLPHRLIESFKSTLDEVRESDVLMHVVDVSHPLFEDHISVVNETLNEIGASGLPELLVFNKIDALENMGLLHQLKERFPGAAFVSGLRGIGLADLKRRLLDVVEADYVERLAYLPMDAAKTVAHLHRVTEVLNEAYVSGLDASDEEVPVVRIRFRASQKLAADLDRVLIRYAGYKPAEHQPDKPSDGDGAPANPPAQTDETTSEGDRLPTGTPVVSVTSTAS